jgi:hypothetical protein
VGDIVLRLPRTHDPTADAEGGGDGEAAPAPAPAPAAAAATATATAADAPVDAAEAEPASVADAADAADEEGEDEGEEGEEGGAVSKLASGTLKAIGEVVAVGARLTVRWMDGSVGEIEPEEVRSPGEMPRTAPPLAPPSSLTRRDGRTSTIPRTS